MKGLKLIKRVRAHNVIDEIKLLFLAGKLQLDGLNCKIEMVIEVDGTRYKLVDLESLCIVCPSYEEWIWKYLKLNTGETFVDVGAHIGKYTLRVAKIVGNKGKVIAIEPEPENFKALSYGVKLSELTNIIALNVAAWDKECVLPLYVGETNGKLSSHGFPGKGGSSLKRKVGTPIEVLARPLDNIINELTLPSINWIKIDVEGAEYETLRGSKKTIECFKPKIIVESTINRKKTLEFMKKLGYCAVVISTNYLFLYPD